jgi:hypothetical protein
MTLVSIQRTVWVSLVLPVVMAASSIGIGPGSVLLRDGLPAFPVGFTTAPAPGARAPSGRNAWAELAAGGMTFNRCGVPPGNWGREAEADLDRMLRTAARTGMLCAVYIPDLLVIRTGDADKEAELRRVVRKYRGHPGLAFWKGADEPEWGKVPVEDVMRFYRIVHELDPAHPVWITQAPRGTVESLRGYDPAYDVAAVDVYPVSYPPGLHGDIPNKGISMVGDYALRMVEVTGGNKPLWTVLQICFSGVTKPGRTLRFPTFPEERYMSYLSIIEGARGLVYFGGNVAACWNDSDRALGWNWTFYRKVLEPLLREFRPASPLYPALVGRDARIPVTVEGAPDVEFRVREAGRALFLIAAKREGTTVSVTFHGMPDNTGTGEVLFEEPRRVRASGGSFSDWFGPNEVHVYRFERLY